VCEEPRLNFDILAIDQFGLNFHPTSDKVDNSLSLVCGQFTFALNAYGHNVSLNQFCSIWSRCCEYEQTMNIQNYWNIIVFQICSNDFRILKQFKWLVVIFLFLL
jgi:hypothetical protein